MNRLKSIVILFILILTYLLPQPSLASEGCDSGDGVNGGPCCYTISTLGSYDPYCNGNLTCDITDPSGWVANPDDSGASICSDIPCGASGQPCCSGSCNSPNLQCVVSLGQYKDICRPPEKFNKTPVTCATPDGEEGVITALGCINVSSGTGLISSILKLATGIGGGLALALILFGVFIVTTSAGSPDKLNKGKEIITSAIIGLVFILLSVFLMNLIGINILGIPGLS